MPDPCTEQRATMPLPHSEDMIILSQASKVYTLWEEVSILAEGFLCVCILLRLSRSVLPNLPNNSFLNDLNRLQQLRFIDAQRWRKSDDVAMCWFG